MPAPVVSPALEPHLTRLRDRLRSRLWQAFDARGFWAGRLSSSALSTAVAVIALGQVDRQRYGPLIQPGVHWLVSHRNADGGWGDTPSSPSNLSTTLLVWCALTQPDSGAPTPALEDADNWLKRRLGDLRPESIRTAVLRCYGQDRTFSAPILTVCALTGKLGQGKPAWAQVPQLPFELSILPRWLFRWLDLQVVSYALPALVAIGLVRFRSGPTPALFPRLVRPGLISPALKRLQQLQPTHGGFLEATPLTAFVTLSLAAAGYRHHPVVTQGVEFLRQSQREDGSWPIDSNLATWLTTLAINQALPHQPSESAVPPSAREPIVAWLLRQQGSEIHPFTGAAPGGWAWTDLPGGVPDADDTSGALLALHRLKADDPAVIQAARAGVEWLLDLQNRDGGVPTFCRGWGKLPFDRSCPDITAHALRALSVWRNQMPPALQDRIQRFLKSGLAFLAHAQNPEGTWTPLWFGNQHAPGQHNLTYGTAQVLLALAQMTGNDFGPARALRDKAVQWLMGVQNAEGSWGGDNGVAGSLEETGLALSALMECGARHHPGLDRGLQWILATTNDGQVLPSAPLGLYFSALWYEEQLYPLLFSLGALNRAISLCQSGASELK